MLPQELIEQVIDLVSGRTLLTCASVCKSWQPRCQQHLYRIVHLKARRQLCLFYRSLSSSISLAELVELVVLLEPIYSPHVSDSTDLDIATVLLASVLPNLKALSVRNEAEERSGTLHMGPTTFRSARSMFSLSKLVLHKLRFVTLTSFGRFILAFPSLEVLHCTQLEQVSRGEEQLVQALLSRSLKISVLNIDMVDRQILGFLLRTSHQHLAHLTIDVGMHRGLGEVFMELVQPMAQLSSLEIHFDCPSFSFGYQEIEVIRSIVGRASADGSAKLKVLFEAYAAIPILRDGLARTSDDLRRLDNFLCSLPRLRHATFVIPHETSGRRTFWRTTFQNCFVGLREQGCLSVTSGLSSEEDEGADSYRYLLLSTQDGNYYRQQRPWACPGAGHSLAILSLAVSPDSKWVASGSADETIIIWDPESNRILGKWRANVGRLWHLAFSPSSRRIACSGDRGSVVVWDVEKGEEAGRLEGHTDDVLIVAWSPDSTKLASASDDRTVRIWDAETYRQIYMLQGHDARVTFIVFSSDGSLLASGGADHDCRVWDVETGTLKRKLSHKGVVRTATFDPDSDTRRIATGSNDGCVRIWSVETGEELLTLHGYYGLTWVIVFSQDGKQILSAPSDSTVRVHDSWSGQMLLALEGHGGLVNAAQFSPDGKYIASASMDNEVLLWRRSDGTRIATFTEHVDAVTHVAFSPNGRTLSSGGLDGMVYIRTLSDFVD